ncbi:MAG: carboxypeptidase-like regulatory domain-containing protein, partial [Bacteroidales bacterium]|nr:carboxypeptidase-like regulatory domain-containing protein [Bacteroidales bacterium]
MKTKKLSLIIFIIFVFSFLNGNSQQKDAAYIQGNVTDANTGNALAEVYVINETDTTQTNASGYYLMETSSGVYDVLFKKCGYQDYIEEGVVTIPNDTIIVNAQLWEELYAPPWVVATTNDDDTECEVDWTFYNPYFEIFYDDGSADDYVCWMTAGNAGAVKFTPAGYPVNIIGGKVYVGDGSFPSGANFLGTTFKIIVFDDDGPDGFPGTKLDSVEVVVNNYFWVDFSNLDATIYDGDFYIAMVQQTIPPDIPPVGVDYTIPTVYRSYNYNVSTDMWTLSPYQDMMIRAIVTDTNGKKLQSFPAKEKLLKPENKNITSREITGYKLVRYSDFNPDSIPSSGTINILLENTMSTIYNDTAYGGLEGGWYAYGAAARYDQNGYVWSDYEISNIVGHNNYFDVKINVSTSNGEIADSAEIVLTGIDYPNWDYKAFTDTSATELFPDVWKGFYNLSVIKQGYEEYLLTDYFIDKNDTIDVVLE